MNPPVSSPLLAVDVGNSRVKFGLFDRDADGGLPELLRSLAIAPGAEVPWDELLGWTPGEAPEAIIAGAHPEVRDEIAAGWSEQLPAPLTLSDPGDLDLVTGVEHPERAGIDRLLNAVAVNCLRETTRPAIIVDSGTATTVDAIDADGTFRGGAILPGFGLLARSLHRYTALLPLITLAELGSGPPEPLGVDTPAAIKSGLFHGQLGAVRELITSLAARLGNDDPEVYLTGGGGPLLSTGLTDARLVPHLGLRGLARAAIDGAAP